MATVNLYKRISHILPVFFVLDLILQVSGYSSGPPVSVCNDMIPGHRVTAAISAPPYDIGLSSNTYSANQQISVTIEGKSGETFRGFMLAARRKGDLENFGRFIPVSGTQGVTCSNKEDSAIAHADNPDRPRLEFRWEAPATNVGDLQITGTILQSFRIFWVNVTSELLRPSSQDGAFVYPSTDHAATVSSLTTTVSPPEVNEIRCKSSKNCLIQWRMDKDASETRFNFSLESLNANMYIALGLSYDAKMGHDSVMECLRYPNGSIIAQLSYNSGHSNTLLPSKSVILTSASFENGWMKCSFTRRNTVDNANIFNLDANEWYLLVAIGDVDMSKPRQKAYHSIFFPSATKIDLSKNEGLHNVETSDTVNLRNVHGTLMIFAWVFFASVGMFTARYSKTIDQTIKGVALWFQLHRFSMVSTLLFTSVGFIVIFVATGGKYSEETAIPYAAHPVLGIIVTILTIINPCMAYFRPAKDSRKRASFNWAHRLVGLYAFIFADAAIFIGILWVPNGATNQAGSIVVMSIFIIYKFIAVVAMETLECWRQRTAGPIEMKAPGETRTTEEQQKEEHFGFIKTILLGCHIIISFVLSVTLVIFLNM